MDKNNSWNSNNCSSGGTASSRSSSYFQKGIKVAEHLSNLRQLMKIPIHAIDKAYVVAMDQMPATDHLEYYYISSPKALELFPNYNDIIKPIIAILEFQQRFYQSKSVLVLDLLTLLTIMSNGALIDKAKLLFTMYNISKSGLMIELEHRNFLLRVKYCLQKLRLVQTLDLNEKECDYLALEARTMLIENDNVCKIQYLPGLYFNDFYNWINTSNECQQLFIFFRVLTRLTDTMTVLADRTASLHSIMEEKMAYKINCITYPSINLFTYDKSTDGIHKDMSVQVVFRSQTAISLLVKVPATNCKVLYIKYDKVVLAPQPLYEIPAVIAERNKELNEKMTNKNIHCCDKYYVLSATKCHAIIDKHIHFGNTPYTRVDMDGLDSGNRYFFTIYNEQFRYPVVEAYTLEEKKKHLSNTYVLPTNVHEQAAKFIDSVIKDDAEQTFVHTGVVFDIHQVIFSVLYHPYYFFLSWGTVLNLAVLVICNYSCIMF